MPTEAQAKAQTENKCLCGCGDAILKQFKPGRDARYASFIRRQVEEGTMTRQQALRLAASVSPAFASKVTKSLDSLAKKQAKPAAEPKADPNENISHRQGLQDPQAKAEAAK